MYRPDNHLTVRKLVRISQQAVATSLIKLSGGGPVDGPAAGSTGHRWTNRKRRAVVQNQPGPDQTHRADASVHVDDVKRQSWARTCAANCASGANPAWPEANRSYVRNTSSSYESTGRFISLNVDADVLNVTIITPKGCESSRRDLGSHVLFRAFNQSQTHAQTGRALVVIPPPNALSGTNTCSQYLPVLSLEQLFAFIPLPSLASKCSK